MSISTKIFVLAYVAYSESLLLIYRCVSVNVDDAMDDMFRQFRGVSDNISGALNLATSGIRQRFPLGSGDMGQAVATSSAQMNTNLTSKSSTSPLTGPLATLVIPDSEFGEKLPSNTSILEEEYEGNYGSYAEDQLNSVERVGSMEWHSDGEMAGDSLEANASKAAAHDYRWSERRFDRALSDGHSPVDSFASDLIEDELVIPQEV
jgi:sorting nexin-13